MAGPKSAAYAEESAEVEVLLASLSKTKDLTRRITSSMSRLDASGRVVKDAIGPIYSNTRQLQLQTRNIDLINETIERVRQPLDARSREEEIIKSGPKSVGLPQYLGALKRVDQALTNLNSSNLRSNQQAISDFHSTLTMGVNQINDLYRQMLQEDTQSVEPLHYLTKQLPFPTIPQEKVSFLSQIAAAILSAGAQSARLGHRDEDVAARMYSETRGDYLQNSLQNLATASINTSKRKGNETEIYRRGSSGIGTYASGLEGMVLAEYENTSRIFRNDSGRVLTMTCAKALSTFSRTLVEINSFIKAKVLTDCFLAYEILDLITPIAFRINDRTKSLRPQISEAVRPIRDTARSSLSELITQTRAQVEALTTLPPDGNTVPLVSQTSTRLHHLAQFDQPLLALLTSLGDGNWRSPAAAGGLASSSSLNLELTPSAENPSLLSHYLLDLLGALLDPLTSKCQAIHRTKPLQGIFLLNSIAILARAVQASADLSRYLGISPHSAKLDGYRKAASSICLAAWREPSGFLLDTINTSANRQSGSGGALDSSSIIKSLSSKDKDKIKEKFRSFNASFDDLVARHKSMYMEKEVRGSLSREITAMIEPLYARFWDRYHEVDKGKGKVVKYSKVEMGGVLAGL